MAGPASKFSVTVLGSNSALPANGRHPSSQLLNANGHYYLIDCGEGTQMQLRRYGVKMQRIKAVFISHMHGDHYFGLVGLLNSMHLLGRKLPLEIHAPAALKPIVDLQLDAAGGRLQFPMSCVDIPSFDSGEAELYRDDQISVRAFHLKHRIPCFGFRFTEQERPRTYLPEKGGPIGVRVKHIPALKRGEDVELDDGTLVACEDVTTAPPPVRSYAYCTDTLPLDSTVTHAFRANLMYHEATFLSSEAKRSKETFHSTAAQAAQIASKAEVGALLIGHYSARYADIEGHLKEARAIFDNTHVAVEGGELEILPHPSPYSE